MVIERFIKLRLLKKKSSGASLIFCQFTNLKATDLPLASLSCVVISSWSDNGTRYMFHLVEWDLSQSGNKLYSFIYIFNYILATIASVGIS